MKQLIIFTLLSLINTAIIAQQKTLSPQERDKAIQLLQQTENDVFAAVKGLSDEQLDYKPATDKWSVAECVKHIAAAEKELWAIAEPVLSQAPNSEKRADIKFMDDELIKAVEDRSHKSKTFAALEPGNSSYKTIEEALAAFKVNREKLIALVNNTQVDLRSHVVVLQVGTYDLYQYILLIGAHSNRHTQQIDEVKANKDFPAK
ncbi:DinB family protein [Chitinophagaceae bacterium MMS25-I14]